MLVSDLDVILRKLARLPTIHPIYFGGAWSVTIDDAADRVSPVGYGRAETLLDAIEASIRDIRTKLALAMVADRARDEAQAIEMGGAGQF